MSRFQNNFCTKRKMPFEIPFLHQPFCLFCLKDRETFPLLVHSPECLQKPHLGHQEPRAQNSVQVSSCADDKDPSPAVSRSWIRSSVDRTYTRLVWDAGISNRAVTTTPSIYPARTCWSPLACRTSGTHTLPGKRQSLQCHLPAVVHRRSCADLVLW